MRAVAYGLYEGPMKSAIHSLKYDRMIPIAKPLGHLLARAIATLCDESCPDLLLVPVPLHRARHRERGFNQARALAFYAMKSLAKTHPQWKLTLAARTLIRHRQTEAQAGLSPRARRMNVRGAFVVHDLDTAAERNILLIDDIFTTGATVRAASQALLDAGAASIRVATLSRAMLGTGKLSRTINALKEEDDSARTDERQTPSILKPQASMYSQHQSTR